MQLDKNLKEDVKKYLETKIKEERDKTIIISSYNLSQEEIDKVLNIFPFLNKNNCVNQIDPNILAGVVIKFKSKIIDLSFSSQLRNFKRLMYETN